MRAVDLSRIINNIRDKSQISFNGFNTVFVVFYALGRYTQSCIRHTLGSSSRGISRKAQSEYTVRLSSLSMKSLAKLNCDFGLAGIFAAIQAAILTNLTIIVSRWLD